MSVKLSGREEQILVGVALGYSNRQIGRFLDIHELTVKTHLRRMYARTGVTGCGRQGLVLWGYQTGRLIKLPARTELPKGTKLTSRETEVTVLVIRGLSNIQMGNRMFLSVDTVKTHLCRVFKKTGAHNRAHLITLAWQHNLVPHEVWELDNE
jgi:DNA-binding CsgD family transcriptional regulator